MRRARSILLATTMVMVTGLAFAGESTFRISLEFAKTQTSQRYKATIFRNGSDCDSVEKAVKSEYRRNGNAVVRIDECREECPDSGCPPTEP